VVLWGCGARSANLGPFCWWLGISIKASDRLQAIRAQPRLDMLLLALRTGEGCVCPLARLLGQRQTHISQHPMALRGAGVMAARRGGRFVFYRLQGAALLVILFGAAVIVYQLAHVMGWGP